MNKRTIGLDMDGVIIDHSSTIISYFQESGLIIRPEQTAFSKLTDIADETTLHTMFDRMYEDIEGTSESVLMEGAYESLDELIERGYELHIISRRNSSHIAQLALRRLGVWPKFFDDHNSHFVERTYKKFEIAQQLGITDYVDDQQSTLTGLMRSVERKILFDQFDLFSENLDYVRTNSWRGLLHMLDDK